MLTDLFNLFFPKTCAVCRENLISEEAVICTSCLHQLPLTNYHLYNENTVKKVFYGRVSVVNATSFLYFYKNSITQTLIHALKYKGVEEISAFLGSWYVEKLNETSWVTDIDAIVPVPLHKKRLRKRGYNQVEGFGKALATHFSLPYTNDVLIKTSATRTQVFKSRLARSNIQTHNFALKNKQKLAGKHILLVDDIVTTGATLETCANLLTEIPDVKISFATMAITI
ncbi:ComF family protein [Mesonia maritima]|uniref:ComF family protein n=1 Tax=Mesonia maritima TaxID=1793873 RepID=A0ABU1K1W5_9FLAO|nr:phosphoribosyltransferase family protein [Mesonia maritima]MDR6299599.1 ComF family protein [Mesonia maritima]